MSATSDTPRHDEPAAKGAAPQPSPGVSPALIFWAAVMLLFLGGMAIWFAARHWSRVPEPGGVAVPDVEVPPGQLVTEFTLTERNGKQVSSKDLLGEVWITNFFFSKCPGTCRQQSMLVMGLEREFRDLGVRFVSITCDPENDTPEVLREYAHGFNAPEQWWFLTGDMTYIRRVGAEFFLLHVDKGIHQDMLSVVDKWGNVRGRYNWHDDLQMDSMRRLVKKLVEEEEPPAEFAKDEAAKQAPKGGDEDEETDEPQSEPAADQD